MPEIIQSATFGKWLSKLADRDARARIVARIRRLEFGNPGDVKAAGSGISEMRIDYGPGYRLYFVRRESRIVLLCGGDKRTQTADIKHAATIAKDWPGTAPTPATSAESKTETTSAKPRKGKKRKE